MNPPTPDIPAQDMRARVEIVTGGDNLHMPYLDALLRSLRAFNDLGLEIRVMDFGLSDDDRKYLETTHGVAHFLSWRQIEPTLSLMRQIPGATERVNFPYVAATMRKLALYTYRLRDYALWLDADCLLLEPLSAIIGPTLPPVLRASRNPRSDIENQFIDKHLIIREALALRLKQKFGIGDNYVRSSFNSGVVLYNTERLYELYDRYSGEIIPNFGPYLWGDQAFVNICCSIEGLATENFDPRINVSAAPHQTQHFYWERHNDRLYPALTVDGVRPFVYHFLHYKPVPGPFRRDPLQLGSATHRLFDAWRAFDPAS